MSTDRAVFLLYYSRKAFSYIHFVKNSFAK